MNWVDIEIFACNMNEVHTYIYIFTRDMHELPIYIDMRLQYA